MTRKAFFLSRLLLSVNLYETSESAEALDLSCYLNQKIDRDLDVIDLDLYMGSQHHLSIRLVAYRLPQSVINQQNISATSTLTKYLCNFYSNKNFLRKAGES